jgi:hypothetical protein
MFRTAHQILSGPGNTKYADNIGQVEITLDGAQELPEYINGEKSVVMLRNSPAVGATVLISYYYRRIVPPGIYVIDFTTNDEFLVAPIYIVDRELVIENTTGTEVTVALANQNIYPGSDQLRLKYTRSNVPIPMVRGTDYSIDDTTGVITFLLPLPTGYQVLADYRWQPTDYVNGPFTIKTYQENHTVLPGVVLAVGRRAQAGDRQAIIVSQFREQQARIYGGHWTMSLELAVIAKDPIQMEEMTDQVVNWLWAIRKNTLEYEGITLNMVEPSGETEETYIEATGDMYYESSVSIGLQSEWQAFVPYLYEIKDIIPDIKINPGSKTYQVSKDYKMSVLATNTQPVIKYPTRGFERLA